MKKYKDSTTGKRIVEINDLSYLRDHNHRYSWLQRHFLHYRQRLSLKKADMVVVPDAETATAVHHYYFIPKEMILIRPRQRKQE